VFSGPELKIGSLESEKIIIGSLGSEKVGSLQVHTRYLTFSSKKPWFRLLQSLRSAAKLSHSVVYTLGKSEKFSDQLRVIPEPGERM